MATLRWIALGNGASSAWSANAGTPSSCVATDDGDTSFIERLDGNGDHLFTIDRSAGVVPPGATVNSITLTSVHRRGTTGGSWTHRGVLRIGGANAFQSTMTVSSTSYNSPGRVWTHLLNPDTGAGWTVADANDEGGANPLQQFGISATAVAVGDICRCTQLVLDVDYTPAAGGSAVPLLMAHYRRMRG